MLIVSPRGGRTSIPGILAEFYQLPAYPEETLKDPGDTPHSLDMREDRIGAQVLRFVDQMPAPSAAQLRVGSRRIEFPDPPTAAGALEPLPETTEVRSRRQHLQPHPSGLFPWPLDRALDLPRATR